MENKFAVNEDLSEYFVYFGDKIFHNSMATPDNVMKIWKEFRLLLNQRPLDVEKIKTYTKEMYNIKTTELISNISMNQLKEKSPKFREIEKIKTNFLLKNKSTIYHNENQINPFYENYELDSPCKDNVNNFPSTFAFSMHDFNSNDHKTAICMNEMVFRKIKYISQ